MDNPTKFSTAFGAYSGNNLICISPIVVWIVACEPKECFNDEVDKEATVCSSLDGFSLKISRPIPSGVSSLLYLINYIIFLIWLKLKFTT